MAAGIGAVGVANCLFFGSFERRTLSVLVAANSVRRFRTSPLSFAIRFAVGLATSAAFLGDDNLAEAAFTPADFVFDGASLFLSADDGTAEFFLDLPAFIGGPRDLRLQRC
jgi:hypothetical protein